MNIKKITTIITLSYYLTLATVISSKVVETVFTGSVLIGKGTTVAQLTQEKNELLQEKQRVSEQLASAASLSNLDQSQLASFNAISNPIVLTIPSTVASR